MRWENNSKVDLQERCGRNWLRIISSSRFCYQHGWTCILVLKSP